MDLKGYEYSIAKNLLDYTFNSIGPKGIIIKAVQFKRIGNHLFNLSFGDLDKETNKLKDNIVTNNGDSSEILATVVLIVNEFISAYPEAWIFATGNTSSRTRLYQIGLSKNIDQILINYVLYGFKNNRWEIFRKGQHYSSFLIHQNEINLNNGNNQSK